MRRSVIWVAGLGTAAALLASVTVAAPDWIEAVFGVDPDRGSGWFEWSVIAILAVVAMGSAVAVGRRVRSDRSHSRGVVRRVLS